MPPPRGAARPLPNSALEPAYSQARPCQARSGGQPARMWGTRPALVRSCSPTMLGGWLNPLGRRSAMAVPSDMLCAVWRGTGDLRLERQPVEAPRGDEVLVRVAACGVCATDLHLLDGSIALYPPPRILGHETAGVVAAVGPAVRSLRPGDRVALDTSIPCDRCFYCRGGCRSCARSGPRAVAASRSTWLCRSGSPTACQTVCRWRWARWPSHSPAACTLWGWPRCGPAPRPRWLAPGRSGCCSSSSCGTWG